MKIFLYFILILLVYPEYSFPQDTWWKDKKYKTKEKQQKFDNCKITFMNIADGLQYNNVTYISPYFQNEIYLSLHNTEKGYYSREQSAYIIESFFSLYPVYSFRWRNSTRSETYAFAVGKYRYKRNGFINSFTVSVSLKYINNLWLIDQILVN
ncbi:MAG: DUF4783 domain-containing protein [Ignavibacteria bacterium]|nr:DUF4783 domain-containing protein [Ignavibacteria bacterium]